MNYHFLCLIAILVATIGAVESSGSEKLRLVDCQQSSTRILNPGNRVLSCEKAIDGEAIQEFQKWNFSQVSSSNHNNGWWSARTEQLAQIKTVKIYNMIGHFYKSLNNINITVDGFECAHYRSKEAFVAKIFICNAVGQLVNITGYEHFLSLSEVEVFGKFYETADKLQLTECKKSSNFPAENNSPNACSLAFDGKKQNLYSPCSTCSNANNGAVGWWSAKLKRRSQISYIRIYNRVNCCSKGVTEFVITVDNVQCGSYKDNKSFAVEKMDCSAMGQEIKISSKKPFLNIIEVEVFGQYLKDYTPTEKVLKLSDCAQSSTSDGKVCGKAIDGNVNGNFSAGSCSMVGGEPTGWWSAKLADVSFISSVSIYNRVDCCADRLTDFTISVDGIQCASFQSEHTFDETTFQCNTAGKEIKIVSKKAHLTLCEVQVVGYGNAEMLNLTECQQSSTYLGENSDYTCKKAIDGNVNGDMNQGSSCSIANKTPASGWWTANLDRVSRVNFVKIFNRLDCCSDWLTDFTIAVDGIQCAEYKSNIHFGTGIFACGLVGRQIKIKSHKHYLTLCEVQAFGEKVLNEGAQDGKPKFTRRKVNQCLKPEFLNQPAVPANNETACADACLGLGTGCKGYELMGNIKKCQIFKFDKCSHMLTIMENCSNYVWVHIRNQLGLPNGKLCPHGYGHAYYGSTYKLISTRDWSDGHSRCGAEKGLTKFADASDKLETAHMHWLKVNAFSRTPFYIGGHKEHDAWKWNDCKKPVLAEVWGSGQPNNGGTSTDIWTGRTSGVDNTPAHYNSLKHALCECIDPFA